ncbi:MAG: nitrilase-related carbon-nitrogen hydrolase [Candidatus Heimdallarchaeota archaeon]
MSKEVQLIAIQPKKISFEPLEQWNYFECVITSFFEKKNINTSSDTFVCLPEYALGSNSRASNLDRQINTIYDKIREFVSKHDIYLISGSGSTRINEHYRNRSLFWNRNGVIEGQHDKIYISDYEKKHGHLAGETANQIILFSNSIKIQILICRELSYPDLIHQRFPQLPDILFVPVMSYVNGKEFTTTSRQSFYKLAIQYSLEYSIPVILSDWACQPFEDINWTSGATCLINPTAFLSTKENGRQIIQTIPDGEEGILMQKSYIGL